MKHLLPFSQAIREYYTDKKLSRSQLKRLMEIQGESRKKTPRIKTKVVLAIAVSSSFIFLFLFLFQTYNFSRLPLNNQVATNLNFEEHVRNNLIKEMALNHNKQLSPEVHYSSYKETKKYFKKLDFNPIIPQLIRENPDWVLRGARYENINGNLGIIYFLDCPNHKIKISLFQTMQPEYLKEIESPIQLSKDGVNIDIWTEKGLLLGAVGLIR